MAETDLAAVCAVLRTHDEHAWIDVQGRYIFVESLHRLFIEGYERGPWPIIRAMLVALSPLIPQLEYGSDNGPFCSEEVSDAMLARLDALWAARAHTPSASSSA